MSEPTPERQQAEIYRLRDEVRTLTDQSRRLAQEKGSADRRVAQLRTEARGLLDQNARLTDLLGQTRDQLVRLKEKVDELRLPPSSFGLVTGLPGGQVADVTIGQRRLRVQVSPALEMSTLQVGSQVLLNDVPQVIGVAEAALTGELATVKEPLDDGRVLVTTGTDREEVLHRAAALEGQQLRVGQSLLVDTRAGIALGRVPTTDVADLILEETPSVGYEDIGGLGPQIEQIRDAVELPFRHRDLFGAYDLTPPKGILLYGPPGCGKTMIAKAVAHSLSGEGGADGRAYFFNIKGPQLLNKYVGESERQIRVVFQRARDKASDGAPVVIFFDEMESIFRTRGTGLSSDVETTIVPQLLAEIDGVEQLANVIVIGASNRQDMIDPAILRPGRFDVKIRIERPDRGAAEEIFTTYLTDRVPIRAGETRPAMIDAALDRLYATDTAAEVFEVTYASGATAIIHSGDLVSGALIESIVARAKKYAIKDVLAGGPAGISVEHLLRSTRTELSDNTDRPTTDPADWARVLGTDQGEHAGEAIVAVRPLRHAEPLPGPGTGQYL
ncbi:proteasome ATPase [Raineyella sp. LH-20]|uniref:proteasome ATPase n=1 Tax=Raineyella sp. LH-20 TaxID=3081204 RepID=UPI002954C938|nr:proteasome ATPase [Raineyella sp. LH-20]WOP18024.1 proteasome ATPase [Raineyella sp. LH-20]